MGPRLEFHRSEQHATSPYNMKLLSYSQVMTIDNSLARVCYLDLKPCSFQRYESKERIANQILKEELELESKSIPKNYHESFRV